jgi:cell division protein ZipA
MDRGTVRLILLILGVFFIAGYYLWERHKQKVLDFLDRKGEFDELEPEPAVQNPYQDAEDLLDSLNYRERKEPIFSDYGFDDDSTQESSREPDSTSTRATTPPPEPAGPAQPVRAVAEIQPSRTSQQPAPKTEATAKQAGGVGAPFIIQLSVVAGQGRTFPGEDLRDALLDLDLVHGDMGIFHRYDREYRQTLFSVASLVEPGTFPIDEMESFDSPGVVLFFQTGRVPDPLRVYDDLIATCHGLAERLGGFEWDEQRQPLTTEKIAHMRGLLEDAVEA